MWLLILTVCGDIQVPLYLLHNAYLKISVRLLHLYPQVALQCLNYLVTCVCVCVCVRVCVRACVRACVRVHVVSMVFRISRSCTCTCITMHANLTGGLCLAVTDDGN